MLTLEFFRLGRRQQRLGRRPVSGWESGVIIANKVELFVVFNRVQFFLSFMFIFVKIKRKDKKIARYYIALASIDVVRSLFKSMILLNPSNVAHFSSPVFTE